MRRFQPTTGGLSSATILTALGFLLSAAPAAAASVTSFEPLNGVISGPADTLSVDVTVDAGAADLHGFMYVFEFDPAVVRPVSVEAGTLLEGAACPHFLTWNNAGAVGDSIWVDGAPLGCSIAGPGAIIRIRFVGVDDGMSAIRCRSSDLRDSENRMIENSCEAGTILYLGGTSVLPASWGRVKSFYR